MRTLAATILALSVATPAIAHEPKQPSKTYRAKIDLPVRESYEECLELGAGQRLVYGYAATRALHFNIHYHVGDKTNYAVRKNTRSVRATYIPHKAQGYCLMWTNPSSQPASLEFFFSIAAPIVGK